MYREIIEYNDELYFVNRKIRVSHEPNLDIVKEDTRSDKILKKKGWYWFCSLIPSVEFEEINDTEDGNTE